MTREDPRNARIAELERLLALRDAFLDVGIWRFTRDCARKDKGRLGDDH